MVREKIDALLDRVQKPARYTGGEMNCIVKPWESVDIHYLFAFPDVYEVGMSHLGSKILYDVINRREDALCERVYSPWVDMADLMRQTGVPLFSLETRTPARRFDMLGVTLQYEMSYTNILELLDLAGIPLRSAGRTWEDPIVLAGGPCAFNPEPLHAFIDAFVIGDGEESTGQTIDVVRECKRSGVSRQECLRRLAAIPGVYVPSLYEASYHADGTLASFAPIDAAAPAVVRKCLVQNLDAAAYPEDVIVPYTEIVHDRIMLEVLRGCTRGCRFCQAGMLYRPVRERSVETLLRLAQRQFEATGYENISLSSLSTGDYSCLPRLAHELMQRFEERRVSISLPSLRLDSEVKETLKETQRVKKTSLTFAPEAGTQRLRDVINKNVTWDEIEKTCRIAFEAGYTSVKLYFMMGLPTETMADIEGIAETAQKVVDLYYHTQTHAKGKGVQVTVSCACFVPKPHTPFQFVPMDSAETLQAKQKHLLESVHSRKIKVNYHDSKTSFLEGVFAKGDRRLAPALVEAYRRGCVFDGWEECFRYDVWMQTFADLGIDPHFYCNRAIGLDEVTPWAHMDYGITHEYLVREYKKALAAQTTPPCNRACSGCGANRLLGGPCFDYSADLV